MLKLDNKKFGYLTVIKKVDSKKYKTYWECKCKCGKTTIVMGSLLQNGRTKSCGCLQKEKVKLLAKSHEFIVGSEEWRRKPKKELYRIYKKNAKKRNHEFNLEYEDFINLTQKYCFYCGIEPFSVIKHWRNKTITFIYNGIDRIDNDKGYVPNNCVTCCVHCNRAKHSLSQKDFFKLIERIYNYSHENIKRNS